MRSESTKLTRTQQIRQQDLIAAAIRVINTKGYAATSIMAIAKEAQTSKSTVMYHFTSKEDLLAAVIGTVYADGAAYMKPRIDAATTMAAKLEAYIISNIEYLAQHADQIAAVHQIMLNSPLADYSGNAVELLELLFLRGQKAGEFCDFDARTMAVSLRNVIDGSSFYILENADLDTDAYARSVAEMFTRATKK